MIELVTGDILHADTQAVVNTVNCVGIMGRGIAAQFKRAYPANFKAYQVACKAGKLAPGVMLVFDTGRLTHPRYIVNFPTKRHWRGKSRLEDIELGLATLVREVRERKIQSIAIPPLGCGLGGLDFADVEPRIEQAFSTVPEVNVLIFAPSQAPAAKTMARSREVPSMTPGRAVLIELIHRYLLGLMDVSVSLLEAHKLLYFAQEARQLLRLRYVKAHYGPYAENLRHVLAAIEGHYITGYADGGDDPFKPLELVPGATDDARACLDQHPDCRARFERVARLVEGFESAFGMELLATVHWVMTREHPASDDALLAAVYGWNARKKQFTPRQIHIARDHLAAQGWLDRQAEPARAASTNQAGQ